MSTIRSVYLDLFKEYHTFTTFYFPIFSLYFSWLTVRHFFHPCNTNRIILLMQFSDGKKLTALYVPKLFKQTQIRARQSDGEGGVNVRRPAALCQIAPRANHPSIHHSVISAAIAIALSGSFCNLRLFRPSQPLTASSISLPLASGDVRYDAVWRHGRVALI